MSVSDIRAILVPQGAEYQAVCRGLKRKPQIPVQIPVVSLPIGVQPVTDCLKRWHQQNALPAGSHLLLLGLCGSLHPDYGVGQIVRYKSCVQWNNPLDPIAFAPHCTITDSLHSRLNASVVEVNALTVDRFIHRASEKRRLGVAHQATVVDMEGTAVLETLHPLGITVTMLRVVSDSCHHDMPELSSAIDPEGSLQALPMAVAMFQKPIASLRLIQGSLQSLKVLETLTAALFHT